MIMREEGSPLSTSSNIEIHIVTHSRITTYRQVFDEVLVYMQRREREGIGIEGNSWSTSNRLVCRKMREKETWNERRDEMFSPKIRQADDALTSRRCVLHSLSPHLILLSHLSSSLYHGEGYIVMPIA